MRSYTCARGYRRNSPPRRRGASDPIARTFRRIERSRRERADRRFARATGEAVVL